MKGTNWLLNINSWADFKNHLEKISKQEKGAAFEELTKYYLQFDNKYTTKLKHVWLFKEVPSSVLKQLNLPSNDQGIDLIAETNEGEYWAIQCKYLQDEDQKLSHRKISTFISLSTGIASNISYCLVCTTVDDYASIYQGKKNIGFCTSEVWNNLGKDFFDFVRAKIAGKQIKLEPFKPKPHQVRAIKEAKDYFIKQKNNRGKLVFPCGAGKSLTGYWITEALKPTRIIVAVPSLSLVKQTLEVYLRESVANKEKIEWLCVCSDEGIGKNDDVAVHTQDIGVPCVTDKTIIKDWLQKNKNKKSIVFTTYQSGKVISEACKELKFSFDLGIMDEAHKTVGDKDKLFSHLLFDKNIEIKQRIFMTATERRYAGSSDNILSMDDVNVYGDTFTQMSFKEAIDSEILSDYKIITLFISDAEVKHLIETNAYVKPKGKEWDKETEARTLAALIALRKAMTKYPIHHAVTFHSSIAKAKAFEESQEAFTKAFPNYNRIKSYHVTGAMPTGERSKIVSEFANADKAIITNAKCLTEGVDVPNIDCVLFADPRKSTVDIVQAVGRALRRKKGKEFGYVILPVFTKSRTEEEVIESDEFKEILSTIRALAANDERIIEYFRSKQNGKAKKGVGKLIEFDVDVKLAEYISPEDLVEKLELTTWSKLAKLSWRPFEEAREFVRNIKIRNNKEWRDYSKSNKKPIDLPAAPERVYKNHGWISWGDFLGSNAISNEKKEFYNYNFLKEMVRDLKLKSYKDYKKFVKSNNNDLRLPYAPHLVYKDKWEGWGKFLGTNFISTNLRKYKTYEEAKKYVSNLKIKSYTEWKEFIKTKNFPLDLPKAPDNTYANKGWINWPIFLGVKKKIMIEDYAEAVKLVSKYNIKSHEEYEELWHKGKFSDELPLTPDRKYKGKGWVSWPVFLGKKTIIGYKSLEEAKKYVRENNIKSIKEWKEWCRNKILPPDYPSHPEIVYKSSGWLNYADFFGTKNIRNKVYLSFEEARRIVKELKLKSNKEWRVYSKSGKRPDNIPGNPDGVYKDKGWKGWDDFLGKL